MKFVKSVRRIIAMAAIAAVAFVSGVSTHPATVQTQTVAGETAPGPVGSGVLGDWSTLGHGLYCYQPPATKAASNSNRTATKTTAAKLSAAFNCPGEDVRIYGDSITNGGKIDLALNLYTYGKTLYVDAWSGRPTTPIADAVEAETAFPPVVIVASGTNDIFNPAVMAAQIIRIKNHITAISPTTKLFWVDVQATRWGQTDVIERNDQRNSMAVNLAIYQNMPMNRIIKWTSRFMTSPGLLASYLSDGVHPKTTPLNADGRPIGYDYWAGILTAQLDALGGI